MAIDHLRTARPRHGSDHEGVVCSARREETFPPVRRVIALFLWAFGAWILLTWTFTAEQVTVGAVWAVAVAFALAPLGDVATPWALLDPRRLVAGLELLLKALGWIVVANIELASRVWRPSRPLRSGMVIVPTDERSDGGLAAVGIITSLIVDNQIVDLDRARHDLQYHAVSVPGGGPQAAREEINGRVERLLARIERRSG
jgi:multicomponent Na+:H+ antiporter subunit E